MISLRPEPRLFQLNSGIILVKPVKPQTINLTTLNRKAGTCSPRPPRVQGLRVSGVLSLPPPGLLEDYDIGRGLGNGFHLGGFGF